MLQFPAGAGMNRLLGAGMNRNVPRRRGDEPFDLNSSRWYGFMFPAGAGMNRARAVPRRPGISPFHVPRRRGDEPHFTYEADPLKRMFPAGAGMNRQPSR